MRHQFRQVGHGAPKGKGKGKGEGEGGGRVKDMRRRR